MLQNKIQHAVSLREPKVATYIFELSFSFPLFKVKCMLPTSKIPSPCHTVWSHKDINIYTCPSTSVSNLTAHRKIIINFFFHNLEKETTTLKYNTA